MNRLQAVTNIRQGAGGDDRHRILDEGLLHFLTELGNLQLTTVDILAGIGTAVHGTKALLELRVIILFFVFGVGVIGVGISVLSLFCPREQTAQIVGHALRLLVVVIVHIFRHVLPPWLVVVTFIHAAAQSTRPRTFTERKTLSSRQRRRVFQVPEIALKEEGSVLRYATVD